MFKKRNLVALGVLAIASVISLVGLSNQHAKEVKAEQATTESIRFILDARKDGIKLTGKQQLYLQKGNDGSTIQKLDCTQSNYSKLYFVDVDKSYFDNGYNQYGFRQIKADGSEEYLCTWFESSGTPNYFKADNHWSDGSNNVYGEWESTDDWGSWYIRGWDSTGQILNELLTYENSDTEVFQLVKKSVSFTAGQHFKIVYNSGKDGAEDEYHGYSFLDSTARSNLNEVLSGTVISDSDIEVKKDIVLDFYYKPLNAGSIWVQEDSEASALKFAQGFLSATKDICADNGSADHSDALNKIWSNQQSEYAKLSIGAIDVFENSTDEDITHARTLAAHIELRYGLSLKNSTSTMNPTINRTTTNDVVLMVVVSTATLVSMAAVIYLLTKKKRLHQ